MYDAVKLNLDYFQMLRGFTHECVEAILNKINPKYNKAGG
jgi:hypothetical protein